MQTQTLEQLDRHTDLWHQRERYEPNPWVAEVLDRMGIQPRVLSQVPAPLHQGQAIAHAWEELASSHCNPLTRMAYRQLVRQTNHQFHICRHLLGIHIEFVEETEPYENAVEQARHLAMDRTIRIAYGLGGDHPVMTPDEYARFRAVHDIFGHAGIGGGFDRHGEYQAWLVHAAMFSGLGAWAMSSEYRGVNSSLWAGHAAGTGKAALLPLRLFQYGKLRI